MLAMLGRESVPCLQTLQRSTVNNPPDIGRPVDAFSGMHEIFYKDKSKQDSHRTSVTSCAVYRYTQVMRLNRTDLAAKRRTNGSFKSNKTFLFAHVKWWPMKPKFYNH